MKVKTCSECSTRALFVYRTFKYCRHCQIFIFGERIFKEDKYRLKKTLRLALKNECQHIETHHIALRDKIIKFPELERRVIWRLFYEQTSIQRMADHMSMPLANVAVAYRSAIQRIYSKGYDESPEFSFLLLLDHEMPLAVAA